MKIKGSTLIESLIALVIIVTVVTISFSCLVTSSRFSSRELLLKSMVISDNIIQKSKEESKFESEELSFGELTIQKSVSFVNRYSGVMKIKIVSLVNDKQIYEKEEFVYVK